jgi:nucleotide-binding universal stress UspA family protein
MNRYKKIALASTFSPRFLPLLKEAGRFARVTGGELCAIHAGQRSDETAKRFGDGFTEAGLDPAPAIHWGDGAPAEAILGQIEQNGIDLLIAGAMERETGGRHFLGDVARTLMRQARCSLLLLPKPSGDPQPWKEIALLTDFSPASASALRVAISLAAVEKAATLHVIHIYTIFAQALAKPETLSGPGRPDRDLFDAEQARLEEFIAAAGESPVPIRAMCVEGTTGFAASDYVQSVDAQLLIIPSQSAGSKPLFPARSDWIVDVIPTSLLVVREPPLVVTQL